MVVGSLGRWVVGSLGRWVVESLVVVVAFSHLFLICALSFFSDHERGVESQS